MIDLWYGLLEKLGFEWAHYTFMKNALLALILASPAFALLGTTIVNNRMAFFSDVLGHAALTGIALGIVLGLTKPSIAMIIFLVLLAAAINLLKGTTGASYDTVLGVIFSMTTAIGLLILSHNGSFAKFSSFLIGDVLTVTRTHIRLLAGMLAIVVCMWLAAGNALLFSGTNPILARSRRVPVLALETFFCMMLALSVALAIPLTGILMINSLLILPAAASRLIAKNIRSYTGFAVIISLICSSSGLIISYYANVAAGAAIVVLLSCVYIGIILYTKIPVWLHIQNTKPHIDPCMTHDA